MRKIIYSSKMKKLLIAFLVVLMIFNFIFPNVVWADLADVNIDRTAYTATGSIQDVMHSMNATDDKKGPDDSGATIGDMVGMATEAQEVDLENAAKNEIKKVLSDNKNKYNSDLTEDITDSNIDQYTDKIYRYYRYAGDKIEITFHFKKKPYAMGSGGGYEYDKSKGITAKVYTDKLTVEDIEKAFKECSDDDKVDTNPYVNVIPSSAAAGQNPNPSIDDYTKVDPDAAKADLGGILLSPIFYLVNFVADAIISNLGGIMDPVAGSGITRNSYFARRFSCSD